MTSQSLFSNKNIKGKTSLGHRKTSKGKQKQQQNMGMLYKEKQNGVSLAGPLQIRNDKQKLVLI